MIKRLLSVLTIGLLMVFYHKNLNAQTCHGIWKTIDDKTDKPASIMKLYEEDGILYGDILAILKEDTKQKNPLCVKCPDDRKDQPVIGMQLIRGLTRDGNQWSGGHVVDPHTGKIYRCYLELLTPDKLKVRGYVGFSIFGRTQYWYRTPDYEDTQVLSSGTK
ncbi:MAG: DUF2147 domain-containing protein [Saprospiraceae bacterium]|nr:DUF2147 domain-containing protein [Saprospiraceae bacterium]